MYTNTVKQVIVGPYFNYCMSWDWIGNTSAEDIEKLHNRAACVAETLY